VKPERLSIALAFAILTGGVATSEPFAEGYFSGHYERVGRSADGMLLDDLVRLSPMDKGFAFSVCEEALDLLPPLRLDFTTAPEGQTVLAGRDGPFQLWCQAHNDGQNYPILTCTSDGGARFTLWPVYDTFSGQALPCPK
jgi:hypothetical protein